MPYKPAVSGGHALGFLKTTLANIGTKDHRVPMRFSLLPLLAAALIMSGCTTPPIDGPQTAARHAAILAEPPGDYWVGRRYYVTSEYGTCRFWGYLRRPRQSWDQGQLVVMLETHIKSPDRLPVIAQSGPAHGYDQNHEYRIQGQFTGTKVYDPNSDLELPVFRPTRFDLLDPRPGFLFTPADIGQPRRYIPTREVRRTTPGRL